jgi:hypothetical protein
MANNYPWYKVIKSGTDIQQGDFIPDCPIIVPPSTLSIDQTVEATVQKYNVIILSQSCDLIAGKLEMVLVCPYWPLRDVGLQNSYYMGRKGKEALRRGNIPGYHLLDKCDKKRFFMDDYLVVDFKNVMGVNLNFLRDYIGKMGQRLRLLPPYREHLSQSFARFFMRVGLPVDIPSFQ